MTNKNHIQIYENRHTIAKQYLKRTGILKVPLRKVQDLQDYQNSDYIFSQKTIDTYFRSIISDQKRRDLFEKYELQNLVLKSILMSERQSSKPQKQRVRLRRFAGMPSIYRKRVKPKGTITRVRNRCVITGRSSIVGTTGLSRISFRRYAGFGKIPGLLKI